MSDEEKNSTDSDAPSSFWIGMLVACALGSLLKFLACAIQQEIIGRMLGRRVWVRAAVGINSSVMRSIRVVLEKPGMTIDKSMILVGGPDWPTSVACGIMGLSLPQMLLGTVPVLALIVTSVMLGAFQLMQSRDGWEVRADMITLIALLMQMATMIGFANTIEKASAKYADELAALPYDEEVRKLDAQQESLFLAWRVASDWKEADFPRQRKWVLLTAAALIVVAFHMSLAVHCFRPVTVADRYSEPPISSNPANVVLAPGWIILALFTASSALVLVHRSWLTARAEAFVAAGRFER
eukprot:6903849-Prymnesium_polylepis.2